MEVPRAQVLNLVDTNESSIETDQNSINLLNKIKS